MNDSMLTDDDLVALAAAHPLRLMRPDGRFIAGAVLGNGGLGCIVCVRPDSIWLRFGHNDIWDVRVDESYAAEVETFQALFDRVRATKETGGAMEKEAWYEDYAKRVSRGYSQGYPRPFPCGSLCLTVDRRRTEPMGYETDISTGLCRVQMLHDGEAITLEVLADLTTDRLWMRTVDAAGLPVAGPFTRLVLRTDPKATTELPKATLECAPIEGLLGFRQVLPVLPPAEADGAKRPGPADPRDRAMRLRFHCNRALGPFAWQSPWGGGRKEPEAMEHSVAPGAPFVAWVALSEGLDCELAAAPVDSASTYVAPTDADFVAAAIASRASWSAFWQRSGVSLGDVELERMWYHNLYFFRCSARAGARCPGLFANWSYANIGTAWHGDYHMNYNTQQAFWATFATNHVELHLPYVDLVDHLLPISRKWATEYYGLRGAYFPHSAYPTDMHTMPYPSPSMSWEICETPWTVQSLWWHYQYTGDREFLRKRAIGPMREAVVFLVDYLRRPEATDPRFADDRVHVYPTMTPELHGIMRDLSLNADCIADLTLIRWLFRAYSTACEVLGRPDDLLADIADLLPRLATNPTGEEPGGPIWVTTPGEPVDMIQNVPVSTMPVFPGEEVGLGSSAAELELARRTWRRQQNEGGNELVFLNLQGARLGILDLERFKRQVDYCLLPNGAATDMILQAGGRNHDTTEYDWMANVGIWFENFGLPAVVTECLLQSHEGCLRLFPNWPPDCPARFRDLLAVGAFRVSASTADGQVSWLEIVADVGGDLVVVNPWPGDVACETNDERKILGGRELRLSTRPGQRLRFSAAAPR